MKHILLTNDDGYDALGLKALKEALEPFARLTILAPAHEKSACGHSLSLTKPLRLLKVDKDFYKLDDGTPTDCVFLALSEVLKNDKPDLVISGINLGANMGEDVTYSGTVGAAMESALHGIPSLAISQIYKKLDDTWDFSLAKKFIAFFVKNIFENKLPKSLLDERKLININIPTLQNEECKGIKITHTGHRNYKNNIFKNKNPRGEDYFWVGLHSLSWEQSENKSSDFEAVNENFISLSPIHLDLTSHKDLEILKEWNEENGFLG